MMAPDRTVPAVRALCEFLDTQDIDQMVEDRGECPVCQIPRFGLLDESRVSLPFPRGAFQGRTALSEHVIPQGGVYPAVFSDRTGPHVGDEFGGRYLSYTPYMVIQDIVRSGMFSNQQLTAASIEVKPRVFFSRHELEVNAKAYEALRPNTCDCTGWGSPVASDYGPEFSQEIDPGLDLERDFVSGNPVRTGFRLRSPEARKRRAQQKRLRKLVFVTPDAVTKVTITGVCAPSEVCLNLKFKYIPHGGDLRSYKCRLNVSVKDTREKGPRACVRRHLVSRRWKPLSSHTKYWYFYRKTRSFRLSEHNPHVDDHLYFRWGFKKKQD
jgi:hypothetical protein